MGKNIGAKFIFYGNDTVLEILRLVNAKHVIRAEFREFSNWAEFTEVARDIQDNDALMLVMSRPNCPSYSRHMEYVPTYINKYFNTINCILVYPLQLETGEQLTTFRSISMIDHVNGMDGLVQVLSKLFRKNK